MVREYESTVNGFQGSGSGVPKLNIAQGPRKVRTSSGFQKIEADAHYKKKNVSRNHHKGVVHSKLITRVINVAYK